MRVLVAGNSVALYIRPRDPGARPYGHLLRDLLAAESAHPVDVDIRAENSQTVADLVADCEESLVAWAPDVILFQVGIVECTPRVVPHALRRRFVKGLLFPAHFDIRGDVLLVPDLHARVSLFDKDNEPIVHLGDDLAWRKEVKKTNVRADEKRWQAGKFVHPHDACFDKDGNIFVVEWVQTGRVTLLKKVA